MACKEKKQGRVREILDAFRDPAIESKRLANIEKWFPDKSVPVVSFAINYAHMDLLINWMCSVRKLGLDPLKMMIVVSGRC